MVWTMLKPLAQLSSPQPQGLFLLFLLLMLNWSFKQLDVSTTVLHGILKKWFIYLNLLVMFTQPFYIMFASWTKPFMALNRFLRLGLKGSPLNCFTQVSRPQVQILISSLIYYQFSPLIFFFFAHTTNSILILISWILMPYTIFLASKLNLPLLVFLLTKICMPWIFLPNFKYWPKILVKDLLSFLASSFPHIIVPCFSILLSIVAQLVQYNI